MLENLNRIIWVAVFAGAIGCGERRPVEQPKANAPAERIFNVRGVVQRFDPDGKTIIIKHDKIPGYMEAMTMPFEASDTNELKKVQPGDIASFRLRVTTNAGWIDQIVKTGSTNIDEPPGHQSFRRVREVDPLVEGSVMPDYHFTNELGQAASLSDFKGEAFAITFIFTRCPFPNFCPRMSTHFAEASKRLATAPDGPKNWHLFSISFDPEYDTPSHLKEYAARYQYDSAHWSFLTGAMIDIDAITEQFGLAFSYRSGTFDHTLRTAVIDATGRVQRIFIGNEWKVDDLVAEMTQAAEAKPK